MRKVWNIILLPLLTFVGTLIAPEHVIVEKPINYLWIFLIQIPFSIIIAFLAIGVVLLLTKCCIALLEYHPILFMMLMFIGIFVLGFAATIGELAFINAVLPEVHYYGTWTYIIFAIVIALLTASTNTKKETT